MTVNFHRFILIEKTRLGRILQVRRANVIFSEDMNKRSQRLARDIAFLFLMGLKGKEKTSGSEVDDLSGGKNLSKVVKRPDYDYIIICS